jgi:hypothetical protein
MSLYVGNDRIRASAAMTATHSSVTGLTTRIEKLGHKLCMYYVFSSRDLFGCSH